MKQFIKSSNLDQIGRLIEENREVMADLNILKDSFERTVKQSDLDEHVKLLDDYVKMDDFKDLD